MNGAIVANWISKGIPFGCLLESSQTMRRCDLGARNLDQRVQHLPWHLGECAGHSSSLQAHERPRLLAACMQARRDRHGRSSARIPHSRSTVVHVRRYGRSNLLLAELVGSREIRMQLPRIPSQLIWQSIIDPIMERGYCYLFFVWFFRLNIEIFCLLFCKLFWNLEESGWY